MTKFKAQYRFMSWKAFSILQVRISYIKILILSKAFQDGNQIFFFKNIGVKKRK